MEAIQFDKKANKLSHTKLPLPKVTEPNHILIKVAYSGICGTDLHIISGEFLCNEQRPVTLGHEFSGVVTDVGKEVVGFKVGDRVAADPNHGCQSCPYCHRGDVHFCERGGIRNTIGIFRDGGWAQYAVVPESQVYLLPETVSLEQGALCEPLSCLTHGYDLASPLTVGKRILIMGAGIIGNLWATALHHQGHRRVTISEPNSSRLESVRKLDLGFNLVNPDQLKAKHEADPKYTFDVVIDCSGFAPAIEYAFTLLDYGGKLLIFGVAPPHAKVSFSPFDMYFKELSILGTIINPHSFPNSLGLVEAMGNRYLTYEKLGIKVYKLNQYQEAIDTLKKGLIAKAVFKCD